MSWYKWIEEQGLAEIMKIQTLIKHTKDTKLWRGMSGHVLKGHDSRRRG